MIARISAWLDSRTRYRRARTALLDEPIPAKALTLMRLSPGAAGDRWADLPNPLRYETR